MMISLYREKLKGRAQHGVTLLITVIIMGAIIIGLGISAAFMGQTELIVTGDTDRANVSSAFATACVEEAMFRLKRDGSYTGGVVDLGSGTCTVVISGAGSTRTIVATATSGTVTKSVSVSAILKQNNSLNAKAWSVDTWNEVDP